MPLSNQQYNTISRIYEKRRLDQINQQEQRKKEVYRTVPGFQELDWKIIDLSKKYARMQLSAGVSDAADKQEKNLAFSRELLDLKMEKKKLLTAAGYPYDYLEPHYVCSKCLDTGYVDGTNGKEKCSCFCQMEVEFLYDASQIRELLQTDNFSNLSYSYYQGESLEQFQNAVNTCKNFINNFHSDYRNLLFYGTVGTGKSFLSGCVAKELLDRGNSILYFSAVKMFQTISNLTFSKDTSMLEHLFDSIYHCDLMIIDDLGAECTNDFIRSHLFSIINERIVRQKPVIISTNLTLEDIRERYSDRVFSRISRNYELCKLSGQDIRIQQKLEMNQQS
ncbi:MAG: ATP-binding protein [Lachnospiraceae bacterium]